MNTLLKTIKSGSCLLLMLFVSVLASAHNAVSYISEEAIILIGAGGLLIILGLISGIICLFNKNKALRILTIIAAVLVSVIALIAFSKPGSSSSVYPISLGSSVLFWFLVSFRKSEKKSVITKPLFMGFIEGLLILSIGYFITLLSQFVVDDLMQYKTQLYVLNCSVMMAVIFIGHKWYYAKRNQLKLSVDIKPGLYACLFSVLTVNLLFYAPILMQFAGNGYSHIDLELAISLFLKGSLPILIFGSLSSWVISKTYLKLTTNEE